MLARDTLLSLLFFCCATALPAQKKISRDSTTVIISLDNRANQDKPIDSLFVIFDRFDLTGAGVVRQVFHPLANRIELYVPKGKYYIDVYCAVNHENIHFDKVLNAKRRKSKKIILKFQESPVYTPGLAYIPREKIDLTNLLVTRTTSGK